MKKRSRYWKQEQQFQKEKASAEQQRRVSGGSHCGAAFWLHFVTTDTKQILTVSIDDRVSCRLSLQFCLVSR